MIIDISATRVVESPFPTLHYGSTELITLNVKPSIHQCLNQITDARLIVRTKTEEPVEVLTIGFIELEDGKYIADALIEGVALKDLFDAKVDEMMNDLPMATIDCTITFDGSFEWKSGESIITSPAILIPIRYCEDINVEPPPIVYIETKDAIALVNGKIDEHNQNPEAHPAIQGEIDALTNLVQENYTGALEATDARIETHNQHGNAHPQILQTIQEVESTLTNALDEHVNSIECHADIREQVLTLRDDVTYNLAEHDASPIAHTTMQDALHGAIQTARQEVEATLGDALTQHANAPDSHTDIRNSVSTVSNSLSNHINNTFDVLKKDATGNIFSYDIDSKEGGYNIILGQGAKTGTVPVVTTSITSTGCWGNILMGIQASSMAVSGIGIGRLAKVGGNAGIAMGMQTYSGTIGFAGGYKASAGGYASVSIGASSKTTADNTTAVGELSFALAQHSTAFGNESESRAVRGTAAGYYSYVNEAGLDGTATGARSAVRSAAGTSVGASASVGVNASNSTAVGANAIIADGAYSAVQIGAGTNNVPNSTNIGSTQIIKDGLLNTSLLPLGSDTVTGIVNTTNLEKRNRKGVALGYAPLDSMAKLPYEMLPSELEYDLSGKLNNYGDETFNGTQFLAPNLDGTDPTALTTPFSETLNPSTVWTSIKRVNNENYTSYPEGTIYWWDYSNPTTQKMSLKLQHLNYETRALSLKMRLYKSSWVNSYRLTGLIVLGDWDLVDGSNQFTYQSYNNNCIGLRIHNGVNQFMYWPKQTDMRTDGVILVDNIQFSSASTANILMSVNPYDKRVMLIIDKTRYNIDLSIYDAVGVDGCTFAMIDTETYNPLIGADAIYIADHCAISEIDFTGII